MRKRKLTVQQQNFADEYIISGNASEAYKKSYKNVKKDSTARANSSRLLANANVSAYIAERMEELKTERVADQQERMEFLTSVIRCEVEEPTPILGGEGEQKVVSRVPTVDVRYSAPVALGKGPGTSTEPHASEEVSPVFVEDVPIDG